jgi:hypothetical protein
MAINKNLTGWLIGAGIAILGLAVFFIIEAFTNPSSNQPTGAGSAGMKPPAQPPGGPASKPPFVPTATGSNYSGTWGVDPTIFNPTTIQVPGPLDMWGNPTAPVTVPVVTNFNTNTTPQAPAPYDPATDPGLSYVSGDNFETLSNLKRIA